MPNKIVSKHLLIPIQYRTSNLVFVLLMSPFMFNITHFLIAIHVYYIVDFIYELYPYPYIYEYEIVRFSLTSAAYKIISIQLNKSQNEFHFLL